MTTDQPPHPAGAAADISAGEPLLVVAVCDGHRCGALRARCDDRSPESPDSSQLIREAVRGTKRSVMLSTRCLGPCVQGAVVAVGWATITNRSLAWLWPPVCWGSTETPQRAAALEEWIRALAPTIPAGPAGPAILRRR